MPLMMMMLLLLLLSLLLSWKFSLRFGRHYEPRSALSRPARTPVHRAPSPNQHNDQQQRTLGSFETETTTTTTNRSDRLVDSLARALCGFVYLWLNVVCDWKPKPKTETKSLRAAETEAGWESAGHPETLLAEERVGEREREAIAEHPESQWQSTIIVCYACEPSVYLSATCCWLRRRS